jgi:hypothetical protein
LAQKQPKSMQKNSVPPNSMQFSIYKGGIDVSSRASPAETISTAYIEAQI